MVVVAGIAGAVLKLYLAVVGRLRFSDTLEVIDEQTRAVLAAASLSIGRWQRERLWAAA